MLSHLYSFWLILMVPMLNANITLIYMKYILIVCRLIVLDWVSSTRTREALWWVVRQAREKHGVVGGTSSTREARCGGWYVKHARSTVWWVVRQAREKHGVVGGTSSTREARCGGWYVKHARRTAWWVVRQARETHSVVGGTSSTRETRCGNNDGRRCGWQASYFFHVMRYSILFDMCKL